MLQQFYPKDRKELRLKLSQRSVRLKTRSNPAFTFFLRRQINCKRRRENNRTNMRFISGWLFRHVGTEDQLAWPHYPRPDETSPIRTWYSNFTRWTLFRVGKLRAHWLLETYTDVYQAAGRPEHFDMNDVQHRNLIHGITTDRLDIFHWKWRLFIPRTSPKDSSLKDAPPLSWPHLLICF